MKMLRYAALLAAPLAFALVNPLGAQNNPMVGGDYVEVSSVTIDDGHFTDYANFLADTWRKRQDFAKKQGWITGYEVMGNVNPRPGEPDLILVVRVPSIPTGAESERRGAAMREFFKQTDTQMEAASADRAKYRHVIGSTLWQVMDFK